MVGWSLRTGWAGSTLRPFTTFHSGFARASSWLLFRSESLQTGELLNASVAGIKVTGLWIAILGGLADFKTRLGATMGFRAVARAALTGAEARAGTKAAGLWA